MNRKQLITLLVLVVLIGGACLLLIRNQNKSWEGANPALGKKLLGEFPVNDVSHIVIKQGTNELNLAKKDVWRVRERNNYPADYSEVSGFLVKLQDLKIVQDEKIGSSQLSRLSLTPGPGTNAAVVVDFKDQSDKTIKSLLLGKKHMRKSDRPSPMGDLGEQGWPDGRYVKVGNTENVSLISEPFGNIEPKPEQWLNKDFFKIEKARSVAVTFPNATNSWKLSRDTETAEWKLAETKPGEQLDSTKASGVANPFSSASFVDLRTNSSSEVMDKSIVVETFDNFSYTVKVGPKTNDNYPLAMSVSAQLLKERTAGKDEKPEDKDKLDKEFKDKQKKLEEKLSQEKAFENWVYLVSSWTVDSLLKERAQLMVEKKEEPKKEEKGAAVEPPGISEPKKDETPLAPAPEPPKKQEAQKAESTPPPPTKPSEK